MTISAFAAGICVASGGFHVASTALASRRCARRSEPAPIPADAPPVSIVQPLRGVEAYSPETLQRAFALDYPNYEIIFCLADEDDPIAPLARSAMAAHPERQARLLIGDDQISGNPKLNNVVKGWRAARHDWIVMADSNVLMPPDYIQRLLASWTPGTGVVCSPPIGSRVASFGAEVEAAFLNTYEARWQYAAEAVGFGFAQGKTMLMRRDIIARGGGIESLGDEIAEDAATTKLIRRQGLDAHLADGPFEQPLGVRRLKDVWSRQTRWARLRRATFPFQFAVEILTTSLLTIVSAAVAGADYGFGIWQNAALAAFCWYALEAWLAWRSGWPMTWRSPVAWMVRDLMLPFVWVQGWSREHFVWRGNAMKVDEAVLREAGTDL